MTRLIQAQHESLRWDCGECKRLNQDTLRGCAPGAKAVKDIPAVGMLFERCPKAYIRDECHELLDVFTDFSWLKQHQIMPSGGGKLDQSARFVDMVSLMDTEVAWVDGQKRKAQQRKAQQQRSTPKKTVRKPRRGR